MLVRQYTLPSQAAADPNSNLFLQDQFAFQPTGSTKSALIGLFKTVSNKLDDSDYVHLLSFDCCKAFDTVRHITIFQEVALFPLPDAVYNCMAGPLFQRPIVSNQIPRIFLPFKCYLG